MKTQLAATPTLYGEDAKCLLDSLKFKVGERSKQNGIKLVEYFKQFEKNGLDCPINNEWAVMAQPIRNSRSYWSS